MSSVSRYSQLFSTTINSVYYWGQCQRNIVTRCDGTGNGFGGDSHSNVVKLHGTLVINSAQVEEPRDMAYKRLAGTAARDDVFDALGRLAFRKARVVDLRFSGGLGRVGRNADHIGRLPPNAWLRECSAV
jgi:uncharacterized protein (DUF2235 family)